MGTVFKRELSTVYSLKMKSSRSFFSEMGKRFPTLPFAIRSFEDVTAAKVGVKECLEHDMLLAYPVLQEKAGEVVAQFKSTVAVLAGALPFDTERFAPTDSIQTESVKELVNRELWKKEDKKKEVSQLKLKQCR